MVEKRKLSEILVRLENPAYDAAEARSAEIVERAQLNEAIKVIEELEGVVAHMAIAKRFSGTLKPSENPNNANLRRRMNPSLRGLTEDEHKRRTLLMALGNIKKNIINEISSLHQIVMDIEATKTEG